MANSKKKIEEIKRPAVIGSGASGIYATDWDTANEMRARQTVSPTRYGAPGSAAGSGGQGYQGTRQQAPQQEQQKQPAGGSSNDPYIAQANALYQQMMSRGPFRYDLQGDMLYRQYADQYSQMGKQAMQDAMGTATGLTGGYGNSYAQQVGNQAYQGYLGQLNAMVPEFYDRAYQAYLNEGDRLMEQYQLALQHPGYISAMRGGGGGEKSALQAAYEKMLAATQGATPTVTQSTETAEASKAKDILMQIMQAGTQAAQQPNFGYYDDWYKKLLEQGKISK